MGRARATLAAPRRRFAASVTSSTEKDDVSTPDPSGILCLLAIAGYYRIAHDQSALERELGLTSRGATTADVQRGARIIGLRSRTIRPLDARRLATMPLPAILTTATGFAVLAARADDAGGVERHRLIDPVTKAYEDLTATELLAKATGSAILLTRRIGGEGSDPKTFGFRWFLPSLWRYRRPLGHVLVASLFLQVFGLVTPLFFQVVVDKVLTHKSYSTLYVLAVGLVAIGLFDTVLSFLRTYILSHTTNRIDVELGRRLFAHLLRLPIAYFETRPAGQTIARLRELETVRTFLTGQAMFSGLDLAFAFVFVAVLFAYSWRMTIVVLASIPFYLALGFVVRPILRERVKERFDRGAASQQFLVETVVGMQTIKASAVEPAMRAQWEERLASYVRTGFEATVLQAAGSNAVQYVSKTTNALILLFGAFAVMNGEMSVGALIAFNMIAAQAIAPILRLSQIWQDFQQMQVSIERLGDVLNAPVERAPGGARRTVRPARRRHHLREGLLPVPSQRAGGATRPRPEDRARRGHRDRRAVGVGQVDAHQADPAALRPRTRPRHGRRPRRRPARPGLAQEPDRRRAAGLSPLQPLGPRQHRLRQPGDAARPRRRRRPADRRRRVHHPAAARLRHDRRGARRQPVGRPAPTHRHRQGAGRQPADPDLRRGDLGARLRERAPDPPGHGADRQGPHGDRGRPPPRRRAPLRPHLRRRGRPHRRGQDARRPAGVEGTLRPPVVDAERGLKCLRARRSDTYDVKTSP